MAFDPPLYVTQPALPPLEDFLPMLREIWDRKWLTNCGPFHERFEAELSRFLGVDHLSLVCNGSMALLAALRALDCAGEVITTPFSFVATTHALMWAGLQPVFADIDPATLTLDPAKVEGMIGPRTRAILAVHVYGIPCDVVGLRRVADRHGLRLIYDAAHAFDVGDAGGSVLRHGDLSILSFHATKVFTTFEGGAVVSPDAKTKRLIDQLRNFGIEDEVTVDSVGLNAKMNELSAAAGLLQLEHVERTWERRRRIDATYRAALAGVRGIHVLPQPTGVRANFGYFPILVADNHRRSRDALYAHLREQGVIARRYFYPLISQCPMYRELPSAAVENLPVASEKAARILCLPIHAGMDEATASRVAELIRG